MTTFSEFQTSPAPAAPESPLKRPELILTLICVLIGAGVIFWRAKADARAQQDTTRAQLAAWSAAIEPDFNYAVANALNPTVLARNGGKVSIDFQRIRAQLDRMRDYSYEIFARGGNGQKFTYLKRGDVIPEHSLQQPIRVQNYQFVLALQPMEDAHSTAELVFEILITLLISGLVCLLVNTLRSRREMEATLANESRRLAREVATRKQLEEEAHTAKHEAVNNQNELKQAQVRLQHLKSAQEELSQAKNRLEHIEKELLSGKNELSATKQALVSYQNEAEKAQTALEKTTSELRSAQTRLQQLETTSLELSNQLNTISGAKNDAEATLQVRIQQLQATLIERESRINTLLSTRESAEQKIADLEQLNLDLKAGLAEYQHLEAHASELKTQLEQAQAELQHHKGLISASIQLDEELSPSEPPPVVQEKEPVSTTMAEPAPAAAVPENDVPPWEEAKSAEPTTESKEALGLFAQPESIAFTELSDPDPEPPIEAASPDVEPIEPELPDEPTFLEPEPATTQDESQVTTDSKATTEEESVQETTQTAAGSPESTEEPKPAKAKRKKSKRDDQIPLFAGAPTLPAEENASLEAEGNSLDKAELPETTNGASSGPKKIAEATPAQLRKAVNELMPLLAGDDPGAKECFDEHQETFRSVSSEEAFLQFEQWINQDNYAAALEFLKKAAKRVSH